MIRPSKYMRLEQCVLRVAALILHEVRSLLALPLSELDGLVSSRLGDAAQANLLDAVNTLYLLGVVEYDEATDALVYQGPDARVAS